MRASLRTVTSVFRLTPLAILVACSEGTTGPSLPVDTVLAAQASLPYGTAITWGYQTPSRGRVLLSFEGRIDWPDLGGAAPVLEVHVNETPIQIDALVNKPGTYTYADQRTETYFRQQPGQDQAYWVLFYSPDFVQNDQPGSSYSVLEGRAYRFVLDVTDRVRRGEDNSVTFFNRGEWVNQVIGEQVTIMLRDVRVRVE
jgi:hypothetical protein